MNLSDLITQQRELQTYTGIGEPADRDMAILCECGEIADVLKYGLTRDSKKIADGWGWWRKGEAGTFKELTLEISDLMRFLLIKLISDLDDGLSNMESIYRDSYEQAWEGKHYKAYDSVARLLSSIALGDKGTQRAIHDLVALCRHYNITREEFDTAMNSTYRKVIDRIENGS